MFDILLAIGVVMNIGFAIFSLYRPHVVATASHMTLNDARGVAELRIAFGGFFLGMGAALLIYWNEPKVAAAIGLAWLGAGLIRATELIFNAQKNITDNSFWIIWASEIGTGLILLAQLAR
ncbi:MAG: hypothetical protein CUN56_00355 [Phototrophicales bacterium]|nr:MAG: hypothetical protein CUN56_00355 [Phototrophicales bacterium]